jgi:hypothetical protein
VRALYERVLTEEANRKSSLLWEHYLAFEFEMGDLQSALRLEKRAREALGDTLSGAGGGGGGGGATPAPAAAGGSARNMQLLLLRYQFGGAAPCPPAQRQYLEYILGRGAAPAGFARGGAGSGNSRGGSSLGGGGDGDR